MAKFLLTLWEDQGNWAGASQEDMQKQYQAYQDLTDEMRSSGVYVAGEGVKPVETARTVRVRDGEVTSTDGPFIETKEVLAGITVIEASDLDHALALAKLTPIVDGGVEVRPLLGFAIGDEG